MRRALGTVFSCQIAKLNRGKEGFPGYFDAAVAHEDDLRPISLVIGVGTHNPTLTTQVQRNRQHEVRTLKEREKL